MNDRKRIHVVAAVIRDHDRIFATERGYGDYKDFWEFPGGKVEDGETEQEALIREIREELRTDISVDEYLITVECEYPQFHLSMSAYLCSIIKGDLELLEHEASRWLTMEELGTVSWLEADQIIIEKLRTL